MLRQDGTGHACTLKSPPYRAIIHNRHRIDTFSEAGKRDRLRQLKPETVHRLEQASQEGVFSRVALPRDLRARDAVRVLGRQSRGHGQPIFDIAGSKCLRL